MLPKSSSDAFTDDRVAFRRNVRLVRHALIFLSVLIFFNLIFFFRAIYYFHNPTNLLPYTPNSLHTRAIIPEISSAPFSTEVVPRDLVESTTKDLVLRSETSTALSVFDERATPGWFTLALGGLWVANQALAWYGIATACMDFSGPGAQFSCVMGAIGTASAYAGSIYKAYQWTGSLIDIYNQPGWKREIQPTLDSMSATFNTTVWHAGIYHPPPLSPDSKLSNETATGPRHVFGFQAPFGGNMHVTYMGNHSETGQHMFRFGFGDGLGSNDPTNVTASKREQYQSQYFTSGGIDYISQSVGDGNNLDPVQDYIHVYNQIQCQMTGINSNQQNAAGSYVQIYDNIKDDTIIGASFAPFAPGTHWSAIEQMWYLPTPVMQRPGCSSVE